MKIQAVVLAAAALVIGGGIAAWVLLGRGGDVAEGGPPPALGRFASLAPGGEFAMIGRIHADGPVADRICFADGVVGTDEQGAIIGARGNIGYFGMDGLEPPVEAFAALTERATERIQGLVGKQVFEYDPALLPADGSLPPFLAADPAGELRRNYLGTIHYDRQGRLGAGLAFCEDTTPELLEELNAYLTALLPAE